MTDIPDTSQPPPSARTAGLPTVVVGLLGAAAAVLVVEGMRSFAGTLGPAFLALLIVVTVHPIQDWLLRHRVPGWLSVTVTLVVTYLILIGFAVALVVAVARLAMLLPDYGFQFAALTNRIEQRLADLGFGPVEIGTALDQLDLTTLLGLVQMLLGRLVGLLTDLLFLLALLFFLAIDALHLPNRLAEIAGERPHLVAALVGFARQTRRYVLVATVFGLIVAVFDVGALYWLGVPLPLLWGLLSFITNYIPNIGFVLGLIPPALLGYLEGDVRLLLLVVAAYSVINFVIQSIIQPKIVGDAVGLTATLTFLSLVFWAWVLGPIGALLAVPLSLLAKALLVDASPRSQWLTPFITGRPRSDDAG